MDMELDDTSSISSTENIEEPPASKNIANANTNYSEISEVMLEDDNDNPDNNDSPASSNKKINEDSEDSNQEGGNGNPDRESKNKSPEFEQILSSEDELDEQEGDGKSMDTNETKDPTPTDEQDTEEVQKPPGKRKGEGDDSEESADTKTARKNSSDKDDEETETDNIRVRCDEVLLSDDDDDDAIKIIDEVGGEDKNDENKDLDKNDESSQLPEDDEGQPTIRLSTGIFDVEEDEDDDENTPMDIGDMMEMEMNVGNSNSAGSRRSVDGDDLPRRSTPRRAAAQAAANSIKVISNLLEKGVNENNDVEYLPTRNDRTNSLTIDSELYRCHHCRKMKPSLILVQQFGTDIHLCSNQCFNFFRNPDPATRLLACAKCGISRQDLGTTKTYYWETMNFCSDTCVCNFQLQIGSSCSSCGKKVMWGSLGKYCVRFGSDVRQFCTASCLEVYKKNARVCFHCQLNIKSLGSVVLANIPSKAQPKEFCSQECVEMYVEQNLNQQLVQKPDVMTNCRACNQLKKLYKTLVFNSINYASCSEFCWKSLLTTQRVAQVSKCETCIKFVNTEGLTSDFYLAADNKTYIFCTATCKNVFVLKHRVILQCSSCKVKKYNYDLIELVNSREREYVVCSLSCLPRPSQHILNMKASLLSADVVTITPSSNNNNNNNNSGYRIHSISNNNNGTGTSTSHQLTNGNGIYSSIRGPEVTLRHASDDDIIEIRDGDSQTSKEVEVSLDDDRWSEIETLVLIREPEPVPMRNKACMVRPIRITKETQTDSDELWAMPRVEMKVPEPEEKIRYVPVPVPFPVYLPFPFYALNTPVPTPFPFPVPIPIPLIVDTSLLPNRSTSTTSASNVEVEKSKDDDETEASS